MCTFPGHVSVVIVGVRVCMHVGDCVWLYGDCVVFVCVCPAMFVWWLCVVACVLACL